MPQRGGRPHGARPGGAQSWGGEAREVCAGSPRERRRWGEKGSEKVEVQS